MVPILSGILAGAGRKQHRRTARFGLSVVRVGDGAHLHRCGDCGGRRRPPGAAVFQQWWVITLFAAVFVALGVSMLGLFTLQMPVAIQTRIANISNRQSAAASGAVASWEHFPALIVSTCVGSCTRRRAARHQPDRPNCPRWSRTVRHEHRHGDAIARGWRLGGPAVAPGRTPDGPGEKLFGVMMLAVAAWMARRVVPSAWRSLCGAARADPGLAPVVADARPFRRHLGACAPRAVDRRPVTAWPLTAGSAAWRHRSARADTRLAARAHELPFRSIKSSPIWTVRSRRRSCRGAVCGGFSADWCTSCKEMERYTFTDPDVQAALSPRCCCAPT